jgi:hypothetical protein
MLTSMQFANRYGVGTRLIDQWRKYSGFPSEAVQRDGVRLLFDPTPIDEWLRNRPLGHTSIRPRWLEVVGHPKAKEST